MKESQRANSSWLMGVSDVFDLSNKRLLYPCLRTEQPVDTYLAYPTTGSTENAIIVLTDIFGHKFINVRLIADSFAERGYFVAVPDLFNGDAAPLDRPAGFNVMEWLNNGHTMKEVDPIIEKVITDLKNTYGVKRLGGVGYCFGGKYVTRFLKESKIDAGFIAHPSHVSVDEVEAIERPLSIAAAGMWNCSYLGDKS